jgi:hypothetical protein
MAYKKLKIAQNRTFQISFYDQYGIINENLMH